MDTGDSMGAYVDNSEGDRLKTLPLESFHNIDDCVSLFALLSLGKPEIAMSEGSYRLKILCRYFPGYDEGKLTELWNELLSRVNDSALSMICDDLFRKLPFERRYQIGVDAPAEWSYHDNLFVKWFEVYRRCAERYFSESERAEIKRRIKKKYDSIRGKAFQELAAKNIEWTRWEKAKDDLQIHIYHLYEVGPDRALIQREVDIPDDDLQYYTLAVSLRSFNFPDHHVSAQEACLWCVDENEILAKAARSVKGWHWNDTAFYNSYERTHADKYYKLQKLKKALHEKEYLLEKLLGMSEAEWEAEIEYQWPGIHEWMKEMTAGCSFGIAQPPQVQSTRLKSEQQPQQKEGCYIATAVFGSYDAPQVLVLRRFRDERLKPSVWGRWLIRVYYRWSPYWAEKLKKADRLNTLVRKMLNCLVRHLGYKCSSNQR